MGHHHHESNKTINNDSTTNSENVFNTVTDNTVVTNKINEHITTINNDSAAGGLIIAHNDANTGTAIYGLQELPTNIDRLRTQGLLNSHASRTTTTNVNHLRGGRHSVMTLSELNWFTDALAKAKAAASAEAQKAKNAAKAGAHKVIDGAANLEHKIVDEAAELPSQIKEQFAKQVATAKAAASKYAKITADQAKIIIHEATDMAKAEGVKLANQLISDAEAEGHVLDAAAKAKILALSIQVGQMASTKIGAADKAVEAALDSHRNAFTNSIIDYAEAQGEHLTVQGQEKAMALAALLGKTGANEVDTIDQTIDGVLEAHRPKAVYLIL